jgi:hypothetical protein
MGTFPFLQSHGFALVGGPAGRIHLMRMLMLMLVGFLGELRCLTCVD